MSPARAPQLSRRGLLALCGAVGAGALLGACGSDDDSSDDGKAADGGKGGAWSFTDDRGEKSSAGSAPTRIVAYTGTAAALHDFGVGDKVVGVFGPTKLKNGDPDPMAGDLDVDKVTILGNAWGEFSIEKYVSLRPQLLVTNMIEKNTLWYVPEESRSKILSQADSVGFTASGVSMVKVIERYEELAVSLGADLEAKQVADAKARFEAAADTLRRAAAGNKGIKVLAASGADDLFYVSDPDVYADLGYFHELGVEFVRPTKVEGGFFENLSWENADKYPADVILLDNRTSALQPEALAAKPTWARLPAVKAGQVTGWLSEPRFSYAGAAPLLESLAEAVKNAEKVV